MANEEIVAELAAVRACLSEVSVAIGSLVPKGELARVSTAVVEDNRRWRRSIVLLIIGGPLLFLMNLGVFLQGRHNEATFKADVRQGVSCVLGNVASHRRDQRAFEQGMAQKLNVPLDLGPETNVPADDLTALVSRCPIILRRFLDLSFGSQGAPNEAGGKP